MDCSTPGFPVHHQLLELAQTHVHWVIDAIQLSHPLSSPFSCLQSFSASGYFLKSQFFASGGQRIGASTLASVLPMNIHDWFPLGWTGWISLLSKRLSRHFSNTTVQMHQFFGTLHSYSPTLASIYIDNYLKYKCIKRTNQKTQTDWVDEKCACMHLHLPHHSGWPPPIVCNYFILLS